MQTETDNTSKMPRRYLLQHDKNISNDTKERSGILRITRRNNSAFKWSQDRSGILGVFLSKDDSRNYQNNTIRARSGDYTTGGGRTGNQEMKCSGVGNSYKHNWDYIKKEYKGGLDNEGPQTSVVLVE